MNEKMPHTERCYSCGGAMEGRVENYKYLECGLKSVTLEKVLVFHCAKCGATVPEISNANELHGLIGLAVLTKKSLLTGEEVRFLRKLCGYSVNDLAKRVGTSKFVISRWENHNMLGKESDRIIRLICVHKMTKDCLLGPESLAEDGTNTERLKEQAAEILGKIDEAIMNIQNGKRTKETYLIGVNYPAGLLTLNGAGNGSGIPLQ